MTVMEPAFETHFARVLPIVGTHLAHMRIATAGMPWIAPLIEHLAACGVGRWLWRHDAAGLAALEHRLLAQHGAALQLRVTTIEHGEWASRIAQEQPDLALAAGTRETLLDALMAVEGARCPALLIAPPLAGAPCRALMVFPGDSMDDGRAWINVMDASAFPQPIPNFGKRPQTPERQEVLTDQYSAGVAPLNDWEWRTSAPLLAGVARAMLLRDTPFARADLAELWARGMRTITIGEGHPFAVRFDSLRHTDQQREMLHSCFHTPPERRGALLIAGLGSLGSIAAEYLAPWLAGVVLADPDIVEPANPARQAFLLRDIGRAKADALAERLHRAGVPRIIAHPHTLTDEEEIAALIERHGITAGMVATGTQADFAIARALRDADLPHVIARCYPRARYWEAIIVNGAHGPALDDIRGQLLPGPTPAPTAEQRRAYSDAGALEAEPATLIESGWAAAWLARIAAQLLAPAGLRERWFLELPGAERTCLIGGVGVEMTPNGPAYGVRLPGEIQAWGRRHITT